MRDNIPDVESGDDILADWANQIRDMAAARDTGDSYQGGPGGGYHSQRPAVATSSSTIRYGILRTVLAAGESCIIEERVWVTVDGVKSLECNGRTFRAFDPLGEMYGIAAEAGVTWLVDPNGPTADQLDDLSITLPEGAGIPTETEVASLQRITCVGFVSTCSNYWEPGPCTGECVYEWDGDEWVLISGGCDYGYACPPPWYDGEEIGQQVTKYCNWDQ